MSDLKAVLKSPKWVGFFANKTIRANVIPNEITASAMLNGKRVPWDLL